MKEIEEWIEHWEHDCHVDLTDPEAPFKEIDPRKMPEFIRSIRREIVGEVLFALVSQPITHALWLIRHDLSGGPSAGIKENRMNPLLFKGETKSHGTHHVVARNIVDALALLQSQIGDHGLIISLELVPGHVSIAKEQLKAVG